MASRLSFRRPGKGPVILLVYVAVAIGVLPGAAGAGAEVTAIRFWTAPDHTRVVADLSEAADFLAGVLTSPDRIVIDIPGGATGPAGAESAVGDGLVQRVRLNQLETRAQVVIDLAQPSEYNAFILGPYAGKPNRIVVDVLRDAKDREALLRSELSNLQQMETRIIVVDPGHGGEDPGTLGNGALREKNVVLDIGKKLTDALNATPGFKAYMTRDGDYFVGLKKRKKLAEERAGDLFVSIHANSCPSRSVSGTEVYFVSPRGATDQAARELADRENAADLVGGVSPEADGDVLSILVDLKMNDVVQKSADFAGEVSDCLRASGTSKCKVKQAGFSVLRSLSMPSVLVEAGFLSSPADVKKLKTPEYRTEYAGCLATAVAAYFDRYAPLITETGYHTVAPGETIWSIARRYDVRIDRLRELNGLSFDEKLLVGQRLAVRDITIDRQ